LGFILEQWNAGCKISTIPGMGFARIWGSGKGSESAVTNGLK
jgi:hypothetical protein